MRWIVAAAAGACAAMVWCALAAMVCSAYNVSNSTGTFWVGWCTLIVGVLIAAFFWAIERLIFPEPY